MLELAWETTEIFLKQSNSSKSSKELIDLIAFQQIIIIQNCCLVRKMTNGVDEIFNGQFETKAPL